MRGERGERWKEGEGIVCTHRFLFVVKKLSILALNDKEELLPFSPHRALLTW